MWYIFAVGGDPLASFNYCEVQVSSGANLDKLKEESSKGNRRRLWFVEDVRLSATLVT